MSRNARQTYSWTWQGQPVAIAYDTFGSGPPCLLLPALSTVCTREEMRPLASLLAGHFTVTLVDWPGFGESSRQPFAYEPALFHRFLRDFVRSMFPEAPTVVAAGHAAGYVLELARTNPRSWPRIALIAPTWRGPLPTAMARPSARWSWVRRVVRAPLIGETLYRLNTARPVIALMYRRHVYADPQRVTGEFVRTKQAVARERHARHASVAFVTGALDPVDSRAAFHDLIASSAVPLLIVYGADTPPRSRAEMEALRGLDRVDVRVIPGSLGIHEEEPDAVWRALMPFLTYRNAGTSNDGP
jgi:pimeloyl-ACP methyl ester carboxylesterase